MAYNDPENRTIKEYTHMVLAIAYAPLADVSRLFTELRNDIPEELLDVMVGERTSIAARLKAEGQPCTHVIHQSGGISTTPH